PPPLRTSPFPYTTLFRSGDFNSATLWIAADTSTQSGACIVSWDRATNQFHLLSDIGTPTTALQNSQCVVDALGSQAVSNGNTLRSEEHMSELQSRFDLVC